MNIEQFMWLITHCVYDAVVCMSSHHTITSHEYGCMCQSIKIKPTNMFKINTHGCWNWHVCISDGLSVVQCSLGHAIGIVFFTQCQWNEANMLDNWQLVVLPQSAVVSSIPAGSIIIHRFLCGFLCVSLCQSIKIKPVNMYTYLS